MLEHVSVNLCSWFLVLYETCREMRLIRTISTSSITWMNLRNLTCWTSEEILTTANWELHLDPFQLFNPKLVLTWLSEFYMFLWADKQLDGNRAAGLWAEADVSWWRWRRFNASEQDNADCKLLLSADPSQLRASYSNWGRRISPC